MQSNVEYFLYLQCDFYHGGLIFKLSYSKVLFQKFYFTNSFLNISAQGVGQYHVVHRIWNLLKMVVYFSS